MSVTEGRGQVIPALVSILLHVCVHDLDRTHISAHGATLILLGATAGPIPAGFDGVDTGIEHGVPVESFSGMGHPGVPVPSDTP